MKKKNIISRLFVFLAIVLLSGCGGNKSKPIILDPTNPDINYQWQGTIAITAPMPAFTEENINYSCFISLIRYGSPYLTKDIAEDYDWSSLEAFSDNSFFGLYKIDGQYEYCSIDKEAIIINGVHRPVELQPGYLQGTNYYLVGGYYEGISLYDINGLIQKNIIYSPLVDSYNHAVTVSKDNKWVYWINHSYEKNAQLYRKEIIQAPYQYGQSEKIGDSMRTVYKDEQAEIVLPKQDKLLVIFERSIHLFDLQAKKQLTSLAISLIDETIVSNDGSKLLHINYSERQLDIYDTASLSLIRSYTHPSEYQELIPVNGAWSPDGSKLAILYESKLHDDFIVVSILDGNQYHTIFKRTFLKTDQNIYRNSSGFMIAWSN